MATYINMDEVPSSSMLCTLKPIGATPYTKMAMIITTTYPPNHCQQLVIKSSRIPYLTWQKLM